MSNFGSPGGASAPSWGHVKVHVWVALAQGNPFTLGPSPYDRLDAGNCLVDQISGAGDNLGPTPSHAGVRRLWADLSCDVVDATIITGATTGDGIFAKAEAGTATLVLSDPDRRYDPLNPSSPWTVQGRTRLQPGAPILIWTESLQFGTFIIRHVLFTGTVDSWRCPWTPHASERRTTLQCSDATAELVAKQRPETAPQGAGDTVDDRMARILDYADGPALIGDLSNVSLQATTMAGTAWAQLNAAAENEIGFVHVTPYHQDPLDALTLDALVGVQFLARNVWTDTTGPVTAVACPMLIDATVGALDLQIRNRVTAQRRDGAVITAISANSIARFGEHGYSKTDLQLENDAQVGEWANYVLAMFAFPRATLTDVTLRPAAEVDAWPRILGVDLVSERVQVTWNPPGSTDTYDVLARVVGITHSINRNRWDVKWQLGAAETVGQFWTLGPDDHAALDGGNVLSFTPAPHPPLFVVTETGDTLVDEDGDALVWN